LIFWSLILAWLAVFPLLTPLHSALWLVHGVVVLGLLLLALPRLLRAPTVRLGVPALAIGLALVSLAVAVAAAPAAFPRREMQWAALTACLHAAFFALCLYLLPGPGAPVQEVRRTRVMLVLLLLAVAAGQAGVMIATGQLADSAVRPLGTLGNPNALGSLLAATAVAVAGLLRRPSGPARALLMTALLVPLLLLMVTTQSRGTVAALLGTLLLVGLALRMWRVLGVALTFAVLLVVVPNPLRDRIGEMRTTDQFSRTFLWARAAEGIAEHPLGIGPAMNRYLFPANALDPEHPWLLHQRHTVGLTHNVFLTLTLEWGWLAGAALLALTAWAGWRLLRGSAAGRGRDDPLCFGAAVGACLLLVELQVDGLEQNPFVFSVFLLLLATALARVMPVGGGWAVRGRSLAAAAGLAVLLVSGALAVRTRAWVALDRADAVVAAWRRGAASVAEVRAAFDAAEAALPGEPNPTMRRFDFEHGLLGRTLTPADPSPPPLWPVRATLAFAADDEPDAASALPGEGVACAASAERPVALSHDEVGICAAAARAALARARASNGLDARLPRASGRFELWFARNTHRQLDAARPRAIADLQAALALDPLDVEGHWELAQEALRAGQPELHDRELAEAVRLAPDFAIAYYVTARREELAGNLEAALCLYDRAARALDLCRERAQIPNAKSRAFYERNLSQVDGDTLRRHVGDLLRSLYF